MDPTILKVLFNNRADVEAIVQKVGGVSVLLELMPHFVVLMEAYATAKKGTTK